jgi:tripartite-type tricarboxylate transporter receptor subunit TctC
MDTRIGCRGALAGLGMALASPGIVRADTFPSSRVTLVVPFRPGASTDVTMRVMADKLSQIGSQPVIVDNKGGGNGIIAAEAPRRRSRSSSTAWRAVPASRRPKGWRCPGGAEGSWATPTVW